MTTVSPYRPPVLFPSDARSNGRQPRSSSTVVKKEIPPAVPSPPSISFRSTPPHEREPLIREPPAYKMAVQAPSQWMFTEDELLSTPSIMAGLDPAEERSRRAKGVNFITQAAILLKLPQFTIAVASVFLHRFYMRQSMVAETGGPHHYTIAATSLFLATKTEENVRKTKEVVIAVAKVAQKNTNLIVDEQSKEFWRWKDNMLTLEESMLELLTFDLVVEKPHEYLYKHLKRLNIENNKPLRNTCWAFLNDSCMTMLCLLMSASDVAVASIYFGTKFLDQTIPDDEEGRPWWESLGGDPVKIVQAVGVMTQFWQENPLKRSDNPYADSPPSTADIDMTRRRNSTDSVADIESANGSPNIPSAMVSPPKTEDNKNEEVRNEEVKQQAAKEEVENDEARTEENPKEQEPKPEKRRKTPSDDGEASEVDQIKMPLTNGDTKPSPSKRKSPSDEDMTAIEPEMKKLKTNS